VTTARPKSYIDYNSLFSAINYGLFGATLLFYSVMPLPELVNSTTLVLYALSLVQVQLFLYCEKRQRNPFVLVLVFSLTAFYFPRIITLYWNDIYYVNTVLSRLRPATVGDVNHTLLFMLFANAALFLGLMASRQIITPRVVPAPERSGVNIKLALILLGVALFYLFYTVLIKPLVIGVEERGLRFLGLFEDPSAFIPIGMIFFLASSEKGQKSSAPFTVQKKSLYALVFGVSVVSLVLFKLVGGSRAALFGMIETIFFTLLALGRYHVSRKAIAAAAVLLVLSLPVFVIATYSRAIINSQGAHVSIDQQSGDLIHTVAEATHEIDITRMLVPIFERTAYLDLTVDLIKNSKEYRKVINLPYYFESLVDNTTPGFDVFNVPKASNALVHVYEGAPLIRLADFYQSDQFNVYGEYYALFGGWLSVPAFFVVAFLFQSIYSRAKGRSPLATIIWRYFVIVLYFSWLLSFGTDWLILDATRGFVAWFVLLTMVDAKKTFSFA
jgi:hypothetical protein